MTWRCFPRNRQLLEHKGALQPLHRILRRLHPGGKTEHFAIMVDVADSPVLRIHDQRMVDLGQSVFFVELASRNGMSGVKDLL